MKDSPKNIKWHPAFCSAAKVEMREDAEYLTLEAEHYLSKEPIRIDLLIIKDEALKSGIKNEIGHIMRKYNIIEYKSPKDELNIDDYYKTVGYACLYKGYGENVDIIPADELTVSLFRARHPQKLMKHNRTGSTRNLLCNRKCIISNTDSSYTGAYARAAQCPANSDR